MDVRKITVIQLDGANELLASAAAIDGLHRSYPNAEISLVVSRASAEITPFFKVDSSIVVDELPNRLPTLPDHIEKDRDLVVNLSLSESSCAVVAQFNAVKVLGARWNEDKQICLDDGWTRLYQSIRNSNGFSGMHLIEILSSIANVRWSDPDHVIYPNETQINGAREMLERHEHIKIGLFPGSYPKEAMKQTIQVLYDCGFKVHFYLLGTLRDRPAAIDLLDSLNDAKAICTNLAGKSSVAEMVSFCFLCDVVLSGPGFPSLASSGFGTLNICLLDERPSHTSLNPFGLGHLILQPEKQVQNDSLGTLVAEAIAFAITKNEGVAPSPEQWQAFFDGRIDEYIGQLRAFLTAPTTLETENGKMAEAVMLPLLFSGYSEIDLLREYYRSMWENILNELEATRFTTDLFREDTLAELQTILSSVDAICRACSFGIKYSNSIKDSIGQGDLVMAQNVAPKLQEVDDLILQVGNTDSRLQILVSYFFVNQEQIFDIDPVVVSEKLLLCYTLLSHQAMLILDQYRDSLAAAEQLSQESSLHLNGAQTEADLNG